jgi:tRNA nucleotidyltransferase (CCA-adding enzyme)
MIAMRDETPPTTAFLHWEHFPHAADLGIRDFGATPAQAFEQAALALVEAITDPARVRPQKTVDIQREAPDLELLLVDWLNALVYEMAERRMIFGAFDVMIENCRLTARAHGEPISRERHVPAVRSKAPALPNST